MEGTVNQSWNSTKRQTRWVTYILLQAELKALHQGSSSAVDVNPAFALLCEQQKTKKKKNKNKKIAKWNPKQKNNEQNYPESHENHTDFQYFEGHSWSTSCTNYSWYLYKFIWDILPGLMTPLLDLVLQFLQKDEKFIACKKWKYKKVKRFWKYQTFSALMLEIGRIKKKKRWSHPVQHL